MGCCKRDDGSFVSVEFGVFLVYLKKTVFLSEDSVPSSYLRHDPYNKQRLFFSREH